MILGLMAMMLVLLLALRFIIGWVLPRTAVLAFDRGVARVGLLAFKLTIVGLAGLLIWAWWYGSHLPQ